MKILVPVHQFYNYGGIINHTEQLIAGLKDLGHEVTFAFLKPSTQKPKTVNIQNVDELLQNEYEIGPGTGIPVHQGKGWMTNYYSFLNQDSVDDFVRMANQHDIVIWESIFGFKNKSSKKNTTWLPMIESVKSKQVMIVHDGNLKKLYPWVYKFKNSLSGVACVHDSAYKSAEFMDIPRSMILNPQHISDVNPDINFGNRRRQLFSLQTFKKMKRVDDLVSCVPHLNYCDVIIGGDGIERAYMTSKDKCKEEYYCSLQRDPDASQRLLGNKIWDNALTYGMEYIGFISENRRDSILRESMFFIDSTWSKTYGEHFNRTLVEAMRMGTVPIAVNLGISCNEDGVGSLFTPDENYLMLKYDYTPKQYADAINDFLTITKEEYERIANNNFEMIKQFDRKKIAQDYIDLALGIPCGVEHSIPAFADPKFVQNGEDMWSKFFEVEKTFSLEGFF